MSFVYLLTKNGRPLYAGSTGNIKSRLSSHKTKNFDGYFFQEVSHADRFDLELAIIRTLRPPLNVAMQAPRIPETRPSRVKPVSFWGIDADRRRVRRRVLDLSLDDVADLCGTSRASLQRYERGKAVARADLIARWDAALDRAESAKGDAA